MIALHRRAPAIDFTVDRRRLENLRAWLSSHSTLLLVATLGLISSVTYAVFYLNGLALNYNDARSHLDIARRVVDGLKTGFAQLGSVWLPLPHVLMLPFIWNNFMWHSGLAGALTSMVSYVVTGLLIYRFLAALNVGVVGRIAGVFIFATNLNVLYLQSTAMTEPLLMATMTAAAYELLRWQQTDEILPLLKCAFWTFAATLARYDGWFLLFMVAAIVFVLAVKKEGYKGAEGRLILFGTLAGFGVGLWFLWNQLIFNDALYFIFGPYSAHAQQQRLGQAGDLPTKGNAILSTQLYGYAVGYSTYAIIAVLGLVGCIVLALDPRIRSGAKLALTALWAPAIFNVLALYLGFSALFIPTITGQTWFNVRYGSLMEPGIAVFAGFLVHRLGWAKCWLLPLIVLITFDSLKTTDAVTIDDAVVGASQINVSEVSSALRARAENAPGLVLISAASHDAIMFSSHLPMTRFIHEGTGAYWDLATAEPDQWARWIVLRTNDLNDSVFRQIRNTPGFQHYQRVASFPFADLYEIKPEYAARPIQVANELARGQSPLPT